MGGVHHILQGVGGEQRDPLMPMLLSLLAFFDDVNVVLTLERTVAVHNI